MASMLPKFLRRSSRASVGFASSIPLRFLPSDRLSSPFTHRCYYTSSGGFTSVHGERASSEYAKRRKESLETEFGKILGARSRALFAYSRFGPFFALYRATIVSFEVAEVHQFHLRPYPVPDGTNSVPTTGDPTHSVKRKPRLPHNRVLLTPTMLKRQVARAAVVGDGRNLAEELIGFASEV